MYQWEERMIYKDFVSKIACYYNCLAYKISSDNSEIDLSNFSRTFKVLIDRHKKIIEQKWADTKRKYCKIALGTAGATLVTYLGYQWFKNYFSSE